MPTEKASRSRAVRRRRLSGEDVLLALRHGDKPPIPDQLQSLYMLLRSPQRRHMVISPPVLRKSCSVVRHRVHTQLLPVKLCFVTPHFLHTHSLSST